MIAFKAKLDARPLSRSIRTFARVFGRDVPTLVNETGFFVAIHARSGTSQATAPQIRAELNQSRGNLTLAEVLVLSRAKRTGTTVTDLKGEAKKLISRRASSTQYHKASFIPSIRKFALASRKPPRRTSTKFQYPPGRATVARKTLNPTGVIEVTAEGWNEAQKGVLQDAVNRQTRYFEVRIRRRLERTARKSGFS